MPIQFNRTLRVSDGAVTVLSASLMTAAQYFVEDYKTTRVTGLYSNFLVGPRASIFATALREWLAFDLGPLRVPLAAGLYGGAAALKTAGKKAAAFSLLMKTHSAALSPSIDRRIVAQLREATAREEAGQPTGLWELYDSVIRNAANPNYSLIGSRILVVKAARPGERGVLTIHYSYTFPLLARLFDLKAITDRYFLVLEPSWNGYCVPDILLYSRLGVPVFVETIEPRDRDLLTSLDSNLFPVFPVSSNCWVDHRFADRLPSVTRDIDVIMIAAWAKFKRHWRFFKALAELRRRGHRLKVALVGYPLEMSQNDIIAEARLYGVDDQLEIFERISRDQLAVLLSRSKIHVLWSRREGSNKAMVEAMLSDVPTIVREGFNYGHKYWHINAQTGAFVRERDLPDAILQMIDQRATYSPRSWILEHMTCQWAMATVEAAVRDKALQLGEKWTEGLTVKVNTLDTQEYWNPSDRQKFAADYAFLESTLKR